MPSTYAHYRLGQQVINSVPKWKKNIIEKNKELFNIGLHGTGHPDHQDSCRESAGLTDALHPT